MESPTPTPEVPQSQGDFVYALKYGGAVWAGLFVLGLGFGVMTTSAGLPLWVAPLCSLVIFAGSLEFLIIGMVTAAAPLSAIAVTAFFTNFRHFFYGLSYPLSLVKGKLRRVYAIHGMIDEAYALVSTMPKEERNGRRILITSLGLHVSWASGSAVGAFLGESFIGELPGVEFILVALFVVLSMEAYRQQPDKLNLLLGLVCGVISLVVLPTNMLLLALPLYAATLLLRHVVGTRGEQ